MNDEAAARERLRLLPPIRRARLWRLYAEARPAGKTWRFLDFWMDGGRSILGAKGTNIGTAAKAALDMGLTRPLPSNLEQRLEKALLAAYPGYAAARFYSSRERALAAAASAAPGAAVAEPRPFGRFVTSRPPVSREAAPLVAAPRLPCPAALAPAVLLFADRETAREAGGDLPAPLQLSCAHRALVELSRFERGYGEDLWRKTDRRLKPYFERSGPYLCVRAGLAGGDYDRVFRAALGAGALLSPYPDELSMIPGEFDDGEIAALAAALASLR
jgi:hypothetical protein